MDKKIIRVEIKDGGSKKTFSVRLFGALEGMEFLDRFLQQANDKFSVKSVLADLLPLASVIGPDGAVIDTLSIDKVDTYFENPLAVLDLGKAILEHQMVFMNESETFRKLIPGVKNMFNLPISGSATQSA